MAQGRRQTGTVKWFNGTKGFGFITPDAGGEDLFVHQTSILSDGFRALTEGDAVEFAVQRDDDGRSKAVDVTGPHGSAISSSAGGGGRGYSGGRGKGSGGYGSDYAGGYGNSGGGRYGRGWRSRGRGGKMGGGGYSSGGYGGGGPCYNCGRTGHFARDCNQGGGGGGYGVGGGGGYGVGGGGGGGYGVGGGGGGGRYAGYGGGGGCYNCGDHGHFARECPNGA